MRLEALPVRLPGREALRGRRMEARCFQEVRGRKARRLPEGGGGDLYRKRPASTCGILETQCPASVFTPKLLLQLKPMPLNGLSQGRPGEFHLVRKPFGFDQAVHLLRQTIRHLPFCLAPGQHPDSPETTSPSPGTTELGPRTLAVVPGLCIMVPG